VGECFFLVLAHPGSPGQRAVKRSLLLYIAGKIIIDVANAMLVTLGSGITGTALIKKVS